MLRYLHLRAKKSSGDSPETKGGKTIAFRVLGTQEIELAIAKCHNNDNFCRRIGRAIASGRLKVGKSYILAPKPDNMTLTEYVVNQTQDL